MNTFSTEVMPKEFLQAIIESPNYIGWKGTLGAT